MKNSLTIHKPVSYLVVCRTQRQAEDLWRRLHTYWSKLFSPHLKITAGKSPLIVECRFSGDYVRFISVHSINYIDAAKGFRGKIVYGDNIDKFLDEKEKGEEK